MTQKFSNNARSALVGSITAAATSLTVEAAKADLFPVADTTDWAAPVNWFKLTLENSLGQVEIVKVGTRASGSGVLSNLLRGQDGTTALAFSAGDTVGLRITAKDVENALAGSFPSINVSGNATISGEATIAGKMRHNSIDTRPIPVGGIIMYSGSIASIPAGWQLCNGTNGTPDLRDKFLVGAGLNYAVAAAGGSKDAVAVSHTHTASSANQSVDHTHGFSGNTGVVGDHQHPSATGAEFKYYGAAGVGAGAAGPSGLRNDGLALTGPAGSHSHSFSGNTGGVSASHNHAVTVDAAGVAGTDKNLPPYYALAFIMCMAYA